ncbi:MULTISPECIES: peptidoglycan D,D-transpeptidase FtsI family protein [Sphingomonas]|uniref:Peptidoglycan glycosyltransferase n=1 Tax=Sphingomonas hankookensis TaxID=563996 RepID=A0ABR5YFZ6_9SPHN|nr:MULTISPECIES: penicillin-binding protein 2 [Sphingomonas]KZE18602.1 peptidoglycan glycosyltransferase [Sphingomonas hankookensis]PZT94964.1 MAG: penicillin-binding protein 2 [Sphingomonas sp.]RSV33695.1 penicillin-binding protein 2 [Sphingomonas sp. ABOLH]WCP70485.1 penicillin-binding protein 2 [Sphingomonas hankookensis]
MIVVVAPPLHQQRADGARHTLVNIAHYRLMVLMLLFAAGVTVILARLMLLAVAAEPRSAIAAEAALVPLRGDLVDRNGAPLARTIDAWSIAVRPDKVIGDKKQLAGQLAALMPEQDAGYYYAQLNLDRNFVYLRRRALPELVQAVNALGEPGIALGREPERLYPQSAMAAHALGYLDMDGRGVRGMEKFLNARLVDPAERGRPVALSLDLRVQAALESELANAMAVFQARGAGGIVLDSDTGEVIAMTSLPTFNPNAVTANTGQMNTVTQGVYELGSAFKPLTMAAALDSGVAPSLSKRYDATQPLAVGGFRIRDDHAQKRWLNIPETLVHSSNIATARIADEMGQARMEKLFRALHFDTAPDIELEKSRTIWPHYWGRTTTMTTAYGHGIAVTPLHLASAYAALVNGGIWRPATMLKLKPGEAPAGSRVFTEATSAKMRALLRLIVTDGTGRKAEAPGFRVGGKTGTAETVGAGGGYSKKVNVSTFAAVFPMDRPRYVVIAMLDSPKGTKETFGFTTAAWTAAPVVSRVISRTGPLLGVIPDANADIDLAGLRSLLWRAPGDAKKLANVE